jgi:hypothetical protein
MSPPSRALRSPTYSRAGTGTTVVLGQLGTRSVEVNTCFGVALMNDANGSTCDVGQ